MSIIENLNELARKAQKKMVVRVLAAVGVIIFIGWFFVPAKTASTGKNTKHPIVQMDGAIGSQFSQAASQKVLEAQQREIKELHDRLKELNENIEFLQKRMYEQDTGDGNRPESVQALQAKIVGLEGALHKNAGSQSGANNFGAEAAARGITTTNFSYTDDKENTVPAIKTVKDYVPAGTFAKAVLLSGADTNAGIHGQADTIPITLRILDDGTLPNGEHSSLKGCFVTAAAYGDASSERGQIRLQRLSCVRKPSGQVLDVPIEGTINDMGGSDGIRGHVVMRNNKLIWNAGVSGLLSGIGKAAQQASSTQTISPLGGVINTVSPSKVLQSGAFGGADTALGKLADYYIKLADMYHPIIQVHAGSEVNIVFLKGFSLAEGQGVAEAGSYAEKAKNITQEVVPAGLMQTIKDAQLGQSVDVGREY